jgi:hypothetical protein
MFQISDFRNQNSKFKIKVKINQNSNIQNSKLAILQTQEVFKLDKLSFFGGVLMIVSIGFSLKIGCEELLLAYGLNLLIAG